MFIYATIAMRLRSAFLYFKLLPCPSVSRTHSKGMVILIAGEIAEGSCDQETERNSHGRTYSNGPHSTFPSPSLFFLSLASRQTFCTQFGRQTVSSNLLSFLPLYLRLPMRQCMMDRQIAATEWDFKFRKSPPFRSPTTVCKTWFQV